MRPIDIVIPWTERTDRCWPNLVTAAVRLQGMILGHGGGIYVVETAPEPSGRRLWELLSPGLVSWTYLKGQPNRSWAANHGFHKTGASIMALLDSDMLLPGGAFNFAVEQHKRGCLGGKLSRGFRDLNEEESDNIITDSRLDGALDSYRCKSQHVRGGGRCAGAFWVSRQLYTRARGMCETFHPTGAEDLDMACRIQAVTDAHQWGPSLPTAALHLHHERNRVGRHWQKPLTEWVCSRTPEQLREYIDHLPENFGDAAGPQPYWPPGVKDPRRTDDADS